MAIRPPNRTVQHAPQIRQRTGAEAASTTPRDARRVEREAREQVAYAKKSVVDAQRTASQQIDQIKGEYAERAVEEHARQTRALEEQRAEGYEALRELKRRQEAELERTRREGERKLLALQQHYADSTYRADSQGRSKLRETNEAIQRENQYLTRNHEVNQDIARSEFTRRMEGMREMHRERIGEMNEAHEERYEHLRTNYKKAKTKAYEQFEKNYQHTLRDQHLKLAGLNSRIASMIRDIRQDSSRKLAAYDERQEDPFYQMVSLDAELYEDDDAFYLEARVPPHERDQITVSVSGDRLIVTGARRNHEELEEGPGRKLTTSSYQNFTETFPVNYPVEERLVATYFDGDDMIVYLPKKGKNAVQLPYRAERPEREPDRLEIERPRFPENLPLYGKAPGAEASEGETDGPELSESNEAPGSHPLGRT